MTFSRHTRIATFVAACMAAGCANSAFASGQAAVAGTAAATAEVRAAPGADAMDGGQGPERGRGPRGDHGPEDGPQSRGKQGFGGSRPGAPGLDGPIAHEMPHHGPGGPGGPGLFGQLRHLDLSEAQQDKLFAITHAAAPQQRNQEKAERNALETLHTLGASPQFDAARAGAAARALGQAVADGALLRARLESQVLAVLTPEQREQLRQDRPPGPPGRAERP